MQKEFEKVFLNKYGFYELKNKPSVEERKKEFEEEYYQQSTSSYEQHYTDEELEFKKVKLEQRKIIYERNLKKSVEKCSLMDIGCGEGFTLRYFNDNGMSVTGIDFSEWGISHHNPDMLKYFIKGDCVQIIPKLIQNGKKYDEINMDAAFDMMLEQDEVLGLCHKLLSDEGVMVIKVANNYSMLQRTLLETGQLTK